MASAIIAALPREVKRAGEGLGSACTRQPSVVHVYANGAATGGCVCAGMGASGCARAFAVQAAMAGTPVIWCCRLAGCGAIRRLKARAQLLRAGVVIDAKDRASDLSWLSSKAGCAGDANRLQRGERSCALATRARGYGGGCGGGLAAAWTGSAIKAISDEADFDMRLSQFVTADGQFRETAFALHAAVRPRCGEGDALGRNSARR